MHYLNHELCFPPADEANKYGVLAIGGDLSTERLMLAYKSGIFPWFDSEDPIIWWAPPKRMVIFPDRFRPSKSMRQILKKNVFQFTFNQNFREVILGCQQMKRPGQNGTWLSDEMLEAYCKLHEMGIAKSVEVWNGPKLAGGLYGIDLGHIFCGESMFSSVPNASKAALCFLVEKLNSENYKLLDCQVHNDHLERLGAIEIPRKDFMEILQSQR